MKGVGVLMSVCKCGCGGILQIALFIKKKTVLYLRGEVVGKLKKQYSADQAGYTVQQVDMDPAKISDSPNEDTGTDADDPADRDEITGDVHVRSVLDGHHGHKRVENGRSNVRKHHMEAEDNEQRIKEDLEMEGFRSFPCF